MAEANTNDRDCISQDDPTFEEGYYWSASKSYLRAGGKVKESGKQNFQTFDEAAAFILPVHPYFSYAVENIQNYLKGREGTRISYYAGWHTPPGTNNLASISLSIFRVQCRTSPHEICQLPPPKEKCPDCRTRIELTSETVATLPANRDRTTIGVGESVTIRSNVDVEWEDFNTDSGSFTLIDSKTASITAKDKAGSITVKAKNDCDTESITFNVITPERLDYEQSYTSDTHETMQVHEQGTALFRSILKVTVYPTTVNFSAIRIREVDVATITSTGYFNDGKNKCHITQGENVPCTGAGNDYGVKDIDGRNNYVRNLDTIGIYTNALIDLNSIPPLSTATFDIPIEWAFDPKIASTPWRQMPQKSRQETILKNNGDITNKKGSFSATINVQDPTSGGQFIQ